MEPEDENRSNKLSIVHLGCGYFPSNQKSTQEQPVGIITASSVNAKLKCKQSDRKEPRNSFGHIVVFLFSKARHCICLLCLDVLSYSSQLKQRSPIAASSSHAISRYLGRSPHRSLHPRAMSRSRAPLVLIGAKYPFEARNVSCHAPSL